MSPDSFAGDLDSEVAACQMGAQRLRKLFEIFEKGFIAGREFRCRDDRIAGRRGVNN